MVLGPLGLGLDEQAIGLGQARRRTCAPGPEVASQVGDDGPGEDGPADVDEPGGGRAVDDVAHGGIGVDSGQPEDAGLLERDVRGEEDGQAMAVMAKEGVREKDGREDDVER